MHHAELVGRGGESAPRLASAATRVHHAGHSTVYCRHAGHLTSAPCRPLHLSLHCMQPTQYAMQASLSLDLIQVTPPTSTTYHKHKMQISPVHHAGRTISISLQGTQFYWHTPLYSCSLGHQSPCTLYILQCSMPAAHKGHDFTLCSVPQGPCAVQVKPCLQHMGA